MFTKLLGRNGHTVITLAGVAGICTLMGTGQVPSQVGVPVLVAALGIGTVANASSSTTTKPGG